MPLTTDQPQGLLSQPPAPQGGLLSFISSPVGQGLLGAAFGAMAGRGTRLQAIGQGGLTGIQAYGNAKTNEQAQATAAQLQEERGMRIAEHKQRQALMQGLLDTSSRPAASEPISFERQLDFSPVQQAPSLLPQLDAGEVSQGLTPALSALPRQAVMADLLFNGGKNIGEWVNKRETPDMQVSGGYAYDRNRLTPGFMPSFSTSQDGKSSISIPGADGLPRVSSPPGALETYSSYREADERAKAAYDTIQVWDADQGRMVSVPRATVAGTQAKPQQRQSVPGQTVPSEWRTETVPPRGSDPATLAILEDELRKETDQRNQAALRQEIARVQGRPAYGGGALPAGPSDREKSATAAQGDINTRWLQSTYEPTIAAGDSASSMLANIQTARMGLRGVGTSGYGADARVAAASVLSALGIPQAEKVATSAALFQQAASTRLFEVLGAQKGPQTEGDAARAARTFASISNPDAANAYILDLAQAQAERDRMRASFYRDALPLAQREGDLSKVDREWSRIAPSVFNMPTMKRWAQQKGGK